MLHLREMGCKVVDWVHLAQIKIHWYAFVNMIIVIVLNVSYTYFGFRSDTFLRPPHTHTV